MIYADTPHEPAEFVRGEFQQKAPSVLIAEHEPAKIARPAFVFRQRYIPIEGGNLLLKLTEDLQVEVDPATMLLEVAHWAVQLPCSRAEDIPVHLARRFLELFSKADEQRLSEDESQAWIQILDRVDYRSFCIDRAAPHYVEGTLLQMEPVCRVEWHDGEVTKLPRKVAASLSALTPGTHFSAFAKLGHNNEIRFLERITIL